MICVLFIGAKSRRCDCVQKLSAGRVKRKGKTLNIKACFLLVAPQNCHIGHLFPAHTSHSSLPPLQLRDSSWLEVEEERVLQRRAELQELEEELRRKEEVLLRREACLQQKNKLEMKMLRSSQVSLYMCEHTYSMCWCPLCGVFIKF